jgi:hypothetical protein
MYLGSRDNVSGMLRGVFECVVDFLDRNVKKIRSVLLIVFLLFFCPGKQRVKKRCTLLHYCLISRLILIV